MRKIFCILLVLYGLSSTLRTDAQDSLATQVNLGIGGGVGYCGLGARLAFLPENHVSIFVGGGTDFLDPVFNAGVDYRFLPGSKLSPYFGIMYGYNAVVRIQNADQLDKTYYGVSLTFGVEPMRRRNKTFWNFEINIPFRSAEFNNDWNNLEANPNITNLNKPWPVLFSVGFHFGL